MIDPSLALQGALVASLKASGVLPSIVGGRVYDEPPPNPAYPYITLGDCQVVPDKAECIDGVECYPIINVWSRAVGYPEVKAIAAAITARLDDHPENLTLNGFEVVIFEVETSEVMRDSDGLTRQASITFRALINPSS